MGEARPQEPDLVPIPAFGEAGYAVPQTWDQLIALSDQMVADGRTPWCFGIESGEVTGWVATDWVEELLLRTMGPEMYDQWVDHEIPFTHPAVSRAVELMGRIAFTPDYVAGGSDAIVGNSLLGRAEADVREPPGCWLHRQASFAPIDWPRGRVPGIDSAVFPFPPMDPDDPVARAQAEAARRALEDNMFRFDASDLMPFEVGSDAFFKGVVEYLSREPDSLDDVLNGIEASWPR